MSLPTTAIPRNWGLFGWNYNRGNFKYDQQLRWQRFTTGRKMAMVQVEMFRQDVSDLAGVSMCKLKVYGPIYGIVITVCVTVLVEGRSGTKSPGPPVFISGIYLQCLGIGLAFIVLAMWLLFHAAMRAQIACVQLRTRKVRLPVPTQRALDGSRKLLSSWEEQGLYDMFRLPFVMPNSGNSPGGSDEEDEDERAVASHSGYGKAGMPGAAAQMKAKLKAHQARASVCNTKVPGFKAGAPGWYGKELEEREAQASGAEGACSLDAYAHFDLIREAQKEWWGCEAYMRVCFLFGTVHLLMAMSYWITLHNVAELGLIWCSNLGAAGLTAGVWIIFRLDVLPDVGGACPLELGGPFVASIALSLMYSQTVTQAMMDVARGVAILVILMHMCLMYRLYVVARPTKGRAQHRRALEAGGRLFNSSGSCDAPSWLPSAFQHVMYLVAPPARPEEKDDDNYVVEPPRQVDMQPWYSVRALIFVAALGWTLQLAGRTVECVMGERMLVTNPGAPPWSRTGQWYGWEHGPVSSKQYAHVTPQRGHWAWEKGWGPQGQQELWPSDMFGYAPEADSWWAEATGPEPLVGAAGLGENAWAAGRAAYGQQLPGWGPEQASTHDWQDSGGHRRLLAVAPAAAAARGAAAAAPRPVVPLPVQWPAPLEPDLLACGPRTAGGLVAAFSAGGRGALLPPGLAAGEAPGTASSLLLEGLTELGLARSVTWGPSGFLAVTGSGALASCPMAASGASTAACAALAVPPVPGSLGGGPAEAPPAAIEAGDALRAFVAGPGARVRALELRPGSGVEAASWQEVGSVRLPRDVEVVTISVTQDYLLVSVTNGAAYRWTLRNGLPAKSKPTLDVPAAGAGRSWQSACVLPSGKIVRLASGWRPSKGGAPSLRAELLL